METEELNNFWNSKNYKIWVVNLAGFGKNANKTDRKIIRASTEKNALLCAKENSPFFHNKRCSGTARYADPVIDLMCIRVEAPAI